MVLSYLECLTAELGYSIGDRIRLESEWVGDGTNGTLGFNIATDTTNTIFVSIVNLPVIQRKDTNVQQFITAANWKLVATPYKLN